MLARFFETAQNTLMAYGSTEPEMERAISALAQGWNSHDSDRFSLCFSPRGELINTFGHRLLGRKNIARYYRPLFATIFRKSTQRLVLLETKPIGADVAIAVISWRLSGQHAIDNVMFGERRGLAHVVWTRVAEAWFVTLMQTTQTIPIGLTEGRDTGAEVLYGSLEL